MTRTAVPILFLLFCLLPAVAFAASYMKVEIDDGEEGTMIEELWFEKAKMRQALVGRPEYMLLDNDRRQFFVVNPQERTVMDMSGAMAGGKDKGKGKRLRATFEKIGKGPKVAGLPTTRFHISAEGESCGEFLLSKKAREFAEHMSMLEDFGESEQQQEMLYGAEEDPCDRAFGNTREIYEKHGIPLQVEDPQGMVVYRVLQLERNASTPEGWFTVPAGYDVVDVGKTMREAMEGLNEAMKEGLPPMEGMDDQGSMEGVENVEEMMRRLQEMMQQGQ
ncbi:MAG: hypothetical protein C0617_05675 [Desulfuromonas sp.]|uniref:DUF4412 domain-containing protein n=1 Tax=Desulfuromonas sp. TaxID=892 RepID=UPI000CB5787D|nr:DUF4412 domain-containing protein [Desulfuromonas sp.]PLX85174.1 MAG: hypothetical protein C0617_05675 [Desulfuromonas sp.]